MFPLVAEFLQPGRQLTAAGLTTAWADGLVSGRRFAAQLVSEFNQAKIQVALARAHKLKTRKAVRFA